MSKYGIPIGLALLALAGGVVSQSAQAQTVIFSDNFNGASLGDASSQSGTASPLTYSNFHSAGSADTVMSGQVVTAQGSADAGFSPDYNFAKAGSNPLSISFDFSFTSSLQRWVSLSLGTQNEITSATTYSNYYNNRTPDQDGLVILMNSNSGAGGAVTLNNNGTTRQTTSLPFSPTLNDIYHVAVTYDPTTFAYTYALTDSTTPITPLTASGVIATTTAGNDYMNIGSHNQSGTIDNFLVTAAPEPSQTAVLGLGILGLTGLVFAARRRSRMTA